MLSALITVTFCKEHFFKDRRHWRNSINTPHLPNLRDHMSTRCMGGAYNPGSLTDENATAQRGYGTCWRSQSWGLDPHPGRPGSQLSKPFPYTTLSTLLHSATSLLWLRAVARQGCHLEMFQHNSSEQ